MVDCNTVSIIVTSDKPRDVNGDVSGETADPAVQSEQSPVQSADESNSPMVLLAREKRRRAIRYSAGGAAFIGALFALYHATSNKGTSTVAGILAPAAIMVLYLLWVLYSTRANRHAARVAAAAAAAAEAAIPTDPPPNETPSEVRALTRSHSKLVLNSPSELSPDSAIPNRLRSSALHHSTESLFRTGNPRTLSSTPVHRSTMNLASRGGSPQSHHGSRHAGRAMRSSTLQLNNMRQVAAAAANLPSYEEATNRSHWLKTNNHSREQLLKH